MRIFNLQEAYFSSLKEQRLSLDSLYILERIYLGENVNEEKWASFIQTLVRKGMIDGKGAITKGGEELYESLLAEKGEVKIRKIAINKEGLVTIHKKLQDIIYEITGAKQARPEINGTKYSFLCGETDLINKLVKVITKYKLTEWSKIEQALISYTTNACKTKKYFPLLQYYIHKRKDDGTEFSQLVTDIGDIENGIGEEIKSTEVYI